MSENDTAQEQCERNPCWCLCHHFSESPAHPGCVKVDVDFKINFKINKEGDADGM